ncbi:MAG: conjugal transfer protein TraD [Proteobacteria bacterium]|nr:conjugal transfer protein TraD [Pseudomonadota bacterium]
MTKTNLLEKRKKLEQRKNRLKQLEVSLNVQERKNRTRRLIELGGLVSKAQLENWNANALLGGLLFLKEKEQDASQMNVWTYKGGVAFSSEKEIK